jgi:hypothetical protein
MHHRYPYKREKEGYLTQRQNLMCDGRVRFEDAVLLALQMQEGTMSQGSSMLEMPEK